MVETLIKNPLLLVFMVAAIGYALGKVRFLGMSLGAGAVLFVGLGFGSLHPDMKTPEILYIMGQALFVYTVGLSAGPAFMESMKKDGARNNALIFGALVFATVLCLSLQKCLQMNSTVAAGIFAGSLTSSPALAAVLESIKQLAPENLREAMLAQPVVGFSVTYPMGVIGVVLAITIAQRIWKVDYEGEAKEFRRLRDAKAEEEGEAPVPCTFMVRTCDPPDGSIEELSRVHQLDVMFGRVKRGDEFFMCTPETVLQEGDLVLVVGRMEELKKVAKAVGERRREIRVDRAEYDYRSVFVSNPQVVGRRLGELHLSERFGEMVARIRRGDEDFVPGADTVLELGDMVRVLVHQAHVNAVSSFFGNSYQKVSEFNVMTFGVGLVLGLQLGLVPIPLPVIGHLQLGFAGGPLIMGLLLGTAGRTGRFVWTLPYSANLTLRQIGLVLFLAGVGTRAGWVFVSTLAKGGGGSIFLTGCAITILTVLLVLWVGHKMLKIPMSFLTGMIAGMCTQIAVLGFAKEQAGTSRPDLGYTSVYPLAIIGKLIIAHLILALGL